MAKLESQKSIITSVLKTIQKSGMFNAFTPVLYSVGLEAIARMLENFEGRNQAKIFAGKALSGAAVSLSAASLNITGFHVPNLEPVNTQAVTGNGIKPYLINYIVSVMNAFTQGNDAIRVTAREQFLKLTSPNPAATKLADLADEFAPGLAKDILRRKGEFFTNSKRVADRAAATGIATFVYA